MSPTRFARGGSRGNSVCPSDAPRRGDSCTQRSGNWGLSRRQHRHSNVRKVASDLAHRPRRWWRRRSRGRRRHTRRQWWWRSGRRRVRRVRAPRDRHLIALRVHALHIGVVVAPLHRHTDTVSIAGAHRRPSEDSGACAHRRAGGRTASGSTDCGPEPGADHRADRRACHGAGRTGLVGRRAGPLQRPLPTHGVIGLELSRSSSRCPGALGRSALQAPSRRLSVEDRWRSVERPFSPSRIPRRDPNPRLRAALDLRIIPLGGRAVIPVGRGRRRRCRCLLHVHLWLLDDDPRGRVVVRRRIQVVRIRRTPPVSMRRTPPEPGPYADEDSTSSVMLGITRYRRKDQKTGGQSGDQQPYQCWPFHISLLDERLPVTSSVRPRMLLRYV